MREQGHVGVIERYFFSIAAFAFFVQCGVQIHAQEIPRIAAEGYITAIRTPADFDVDGKHVTIQRSTVYQLVGNEAVTSTVPFHGALAVGDYVEVSGHVERHSKNLLATEVLQRNDWDKKPDGLGVITRILGGGAGPVFEADGYRIRVTGETAVSFAEPLKSLADVSPNVWMRYEGKRSKSGEVVAAKAEFLPPKPTRFKTLNNVETFEFQFGAANATKSEPIDSADGTSLEGGLVALTQLDEGHRIPANHALQERIRRIGESLVPQYQRSLSDNDPSKIHFRFYAVDDDKARREFCSLYGVILIPMQAVDRLATDDRIAAVLADGIALDLQRQKARLVVDNRLLLPVNAALGAGPGIGAIVAGKINTEMEEERGRVALALMAAAGYDPWQAPEAWRLLAPKKLPADLDSLKYPDLSGYQLGILQFQYPKSSSPSALQGGAAASASHGYPEQKQ